MRARLLYLMAFTFVSFACGIPTAPQGTDVCSWSLGERSAQSGSQYACEIPGPETIAREIAQETAQATQTPEPTPSPEPKRKRRHKATATPTRAFPNDCPEGWPVQGEVSE